MIEVRDALGGDEPACEERHGVEPALSDRVPPEVAEQLAGATPRLFADGLDSPCAAALVVGDVGLCALGDAAFLLAVT